jgi:hypothetical protein
MSLEQEFLEEFGTITFSDETLAERGLGWSPAEDGRDYRAEDYLTADVTSGKVFWANPLQLDQGSEGACFPAGTLVRMDDGSHRPIEEVRLLDKVLTAEGRSGLVLQTMVREASSLLRLRIRGHNHLRCTPEHPILTKRGYVEAKSLVRGDEVALTRRMFGRSTDLDTDEYLAPADYGRRTNEGIIMQGGVLTQVSAPVRRIPLSEKLGRLVGLYLAEGATTPNKVVWTFSADEKETLVAETVTLIKAVLGAEARLQHRPNNTINVVLYGKLWKALFERMLGTGSGSKRLPATLTDGPRLFLEAILRGWIDGDGHRRRSSVLGTTVSHNLALDMYAIAQDLGLRPTVARHNPVTNRHARTRRTHYNVEISEGGRNINASQDDEAVWRKVTEKPEVVPFAGHVYNIHVEGDESYVAEGVGVHNCVGFGWTGFLNARPVKHEYGNEMGFDVYQRAQQRDEWRGENYSGTSVRAGAKVLRERGHINAFAFTQDAATLAHFVLNQGPAPIGVNWHEGMDRVDSEGYIYPTGPVGGGHCVIVDGVVFGVDGEVDRFRLRNSWGNSWGLNGRCRIRVEDLQQLFSAGGTACMAVDL